MRDQQEHGEQETEVADAIDDEGLLARVGGGILFEVEADEQVGGETNALPADEEEQEARRENQDEHEKHEKVEVGKEAPVAVLMRHVACGVEMDEEADAGDDAEHDEGEVIDGKGEVYLETGDGDPRTAYGGENKRRARGEHSGPEPGDEDGWNGGEKQGDAGDSDAGQPAAKGSIQQEAGEGEKRNPPES